MATLPIEPLCPNTFPGTIFRHPKGPVSRKYPEEDEVRKLSKHQCVLRSSFRHEHHSHGVFWTRRVPWRHKKLQNADFKIWPILAIFGPLPPLKKFDFWLPDNYAWQRCQSNHCVQTHPMGQFLGIPRDQCQRNSLKKMK